MFRRFITFTSVSIALLSWPVDPAGAQTASLHGPLAGFVFSGAAKTVRPLIGIPGATHMGLPILKQVDAASIAPGGNWALVTRAGQTSMVRGLSDLAPAESSIAGLIDSVDRVAWSRDGSFALLYSSSGSRLQRVQLTGSEPRCDAPLDLSPWGQVTTLAIDPAGEQMVAGFAGSGLYLFAGSQATRLSPMAQPAAAAFDATGRRLFAVDLDRQHLWEFDSGSVAVDFASLAQADGTPVAPAGLAVSADSRYLLLADRTAHAIAVYDTDSRSVVNTIPLDFAPTRFEAISAAPAFLLNGNDPKEWLLVLDASQTPTVYFVPANPVNREARI